MAGKKRRKRRGSGDPLGTCPRDRLRVLLAGALGTLGLALVARISELGARAAQHEAWLPLGGALAAALIGALLLLSRRPTNDPLDDARGVIAALLTVAAVSLAALGLGWDRASAGLLGAALPVAIMGLCPRRPGLIGAGASIAVAALAGGLGMAGVLAPSPPLTLLDLVAAAPFVGLCVAVATRTLSSLREREGNLRRLSALDELTAVANRRFFFDQCEREVARAVRYGRPLSVVFVELTGVRWLNERFGHAAGDRILKDVAIALRGCLRTHDLVGRYGGTVFAMLLPETDLAGVEIVRARCEARLVALWLREDTAGEAPLAPILSSATFPTSGVGNADQLLAAADRARASREPRVPAVL